MPDFSTIRSNCSDCSLYGAKKSQVFCDISWNVARISRNFSNFVKFEIQLQEMLLELQIPLKKPDRVDGFEETARAGRRRRPFRKFGLQRRSRVDTARRQRDSARAWRAEQKAKGQVAEARAPQKFFTGSRSNLV